ncbi:MAG: hypothetical protein AAGA28_12465 [Pseudomonadota bacterium]
MRKRDFGQPRQNSKWRAAILASFIVVMAPGLVNSQQHYQTQSYNCTAASGKNCTPQFDVGTYTQLTIQSYCGTAAAPKKPAKMHCSSPSVVIDCGEPSSTSTYRECKCNVDPSSGYKYIAKADVTC